MVNHSRSPESSSLKRDERQVLLESSQQPARYQSSEEITAKVERKLLRATTYAEMEIIELQSRIEHRELWSKALLGLVGLIILSDIAIIFFTGLGWMKFNNENTIPIFIGSNLLQIFTLSILVVKYLFPTSKDANNKS
ncbi:MAG: hypothetical protein WAQ24_05440 [Candidatus Saccharimonadales bacterium]